MAEDILKELAREGVQKVKVAVADIDGVLRGKYMHVDKFKSALQSGFGFCNVVMGWDCADLVYDNVKYTGWHTGYPDANVRLAPETYRRIPWDEYTPFVLGDFIDAEGGPLAICPRQLLKKVISRANKLGFNPIFGSEFEWFNFKESAETLREKNFQNLTPLTPGMFGYSILRSSLENEYFNALIDLLRDFNIPLEGVHTETGPGVYEAAIACSGALEAADRAVLFKTAVKEIANKYGITATFMARWNKELPGCSGHLHQSLEKNGKNIFYDKNHSDKMSVTLQHFIAGQLHCMPYILPLLAPTVNSYKRLVEGYWAPTKVTWARDNRTVAVRYISGSEKSTRVEFRTPGSDINPYLAIAASLASGLYGIENKLELTHKPVEGNGYAVQDAESLPATLEQATHKMMQSQLAKDILGSEFVEHFGQTRLFEWREYLQAVTDWELRRYFEII